MNSPSPARIAIAPSRPAIIIAVLALLALAAYPWRDALYLGISGTVAQSAPLSAAAVFFSETLLLLLMAGACTLTVLCWFRDRIAFWRLVSGAIGAVAAYGLSELAKILVAEERPCRALAAVTALACPEAGDWSWPSNHSVVAAGVAAACTLALPKLAMNAIPAVLLIALSRVGVGAHFVHDVFSGAALGILVVLVFVRVLPGLARRCLPGSIS
ncbi:phosphatase PAP2 family protein [Arthrobacter sp. JUb115]|uniref:phosphatase PAP2 family protein n=1 Tax=Arthrobacter sp. JUb115 TaxID=2485108 RepID=UPI00105BC6AD|nr:phosphatase PAP2 family protein [Arthrobacter sp. JUb115]TDU25339.1 undecaprenyl-diphosphatase [Arthrobacter sp. JUb115]